MNNNSIRSILVIDDDIDDYELISEAVGEIDASINVHFLDKCENGAKYKNERIDMIFLDINMPQHDGFMWLKGIRDNGYDQPIIMYTNSMNMMHIEKAYSEGANLYFAKPESFATLRSGLRKLINLDWSDPFSITKAYKENGCATFQPA